MSEWHYIIRPARNGLTGWVAFAKRSPFISGGDICEPGEIWFSFAPTEVEVTEQIHAETRAMSH